MMNAAQRRIDVTAENVSNMSTPAYRSRHVFSQIVDLRQAMPIDVVRSMASGASALKTTGNPLDLATDGGAVLALRDGDRFYLARSAQLHRDADGRLVDALGRALQADGGGDLTIGAGAPLFLNDGTVMISGQAESRVGLFNPGSDDGLDATRTQLPDSGDGGVLRAGAIISADVDLGREMVELTQASRQAESGARIFSVYDDLMGQAASRLGDVAR